MKNEEILNQLQEENIDSMFVYKPENIKYISDFYPSSFAYLIINKEPILYVNSIDKVDAQRESSIEVRDIERLGKVNELLNGKIAIEKSLDFEFLQFLSDDYNKLSVSNVIEDMRKTKTKEEITIVASGSRSSSPHSETSMNRVETPIVVDWGARYDHYCSDITRTFIDSERQEEIWNIVLEAQKEAIKTISPGVKFADVDKAAREVISEYGYGEYFIHSTGHAFGLDIHENPNISSKSEGVLDGYYSRTRYLYSWRIWCTY